MELKVEVLLIHEGQVGTSISFDGSDDYINLSNDASLKPSELTVSTLFKVAGGKDTYRVIIQSGNNWNDMKGYILRVENLNHIQIGVAYNTGNTKVWGTATE